MTDEELSISDATLIARWDDYVESMGSVMGEVEHMAQQMRDRIEQLVATNEALVKEKGYALDRIMELDDRIERLKALLREARTDLEDYVTQEYPKHAHPYFERQWNRDMELCRRIDAALKGN